MLIESLIRPSNGKPRLVTVRNTIYAFTEVTRGRFLAQVESQDDQQTLLGRPKLFREFTDTLPSTTTLAKPEPVAPPPERSTEPDPPPPTAAVKPAGPPPPVEPDGSGAADETTAKAQALLSSTPQAIKKQLERHAPTAEVLQAAIRIESAEKKPRQSVLAGLTGTLSAMDA